MGDWMEVDLENAEKYESSGEATCEKCGWQMQDHDRSGFCPHKCLVCGEMAFVCKCEPY